MKKKLGSILLSKQKMLFLSAVIFAWINISNAQNNGLNIFEDKDQDGLTDQEELTYKTDPNNADTDGDGYSDGKEVESGYDPLKPAPGDKIIVEGVTTSTGNSDGEKTTATEIDETANDSTENLTNKLLNKIQEEKGEELGLLQEFSNNAEAYKNKDKINSLSSASLTQEELSSYIQTTLNSSSDTDELKLLTEKDIKLLPKPEGKNEEEIKEKEKKQIEEYLTAVGYVTLKNAPFKASDNEELKTQSEGFVQELSSYLQAGNVGKLAETKKQAQINYEEIKNMEAPYVLKDIHIMGLSLYNYMLNQDYDVLLDSSDPIKQVLLLSKGEAALMKVQELRDETSKILKEYDIDIFNTLDENEDNED